MTSSFIFKLDTHVGALLEELDKIDPVWYNASMTSPYRSFGGSIYSEGVPTMAQHVERIATCKCGTQYCIVCKDRCPSCYGQHIQPTVRIREVK